MRVLRSWSRRRSNGTRDAFQVVRLSSSWPEVHFRDLRVFCPKVAELARLVSREPQHLATGLTFGLCTRKVARVWNLSREKGLEIDRCCAIQTAFELTVTLLMSNTRQKRKNEQEAHDR